MKKKEEIKDEKDSKNEKKAIKEPFPPENTPPPPQIMDASKDPEKNEGGSKSNTKNTQKD